MNSDQSSFKMVRMVTPDEIRIHLWRLPYRFLHGEKTESVEPEKYLMEVKGCTLEMNGIGYFPDAPTERGVKHIRELIRARKNGYRSILAFVIQMDGITEVRPNIDTHPEFGVVFDEARKTGVQVLYLTCHVEPDSLVIKLENKML